MAEGLTPTLQISGQSLTLEQIHQVGAGSLHVTLSDSARDRILASRAVVDKLIREKTTVYGVNTGFGKLADVHIDEGELEQLQINLVRSHSVGVGNPLAEEETRALMLLRANVLATGYSGCRPVLVETLLGMLTRGVSPRIPEKGSVGASGDLAPLAHLALGMIGEGQSLYKGGWIPSREALSAAGIEPVRLAAKEGLALLNGTQAMGAVGALALLRAERVVKLADLAGAISLEALLGTPVAFDSRIQAVRPHRGQRASAAHLLELLEGSALRASHLYNDPRIQDAYSLRCMPQVHGAVRMALTHARETVEIESGSATDNPLVFADTREILSGGNFHGAPLGYVYDYAAIALTDLMSMTERRIDRLVNPDLNAGLPPFLSAHPGVSSGYMMTQVSAAALLNEARVLAHPASVDSVPTSGGKEDHVSMGMTAAVKLRQIAGLAESVLAIELMNATEGLDYRRPLRSSARIERAHEIVRSVVPRLVHDRSLSEDIEELTKRVRQGLLDEFLD
ncbi:MAG TPA: histidine ammonia-lyase [Bryobacteraceae bacterium]|nr:histidine ammonia-lyase [Bryobacteraceae bacterium]